MNKKDNQRDFGQRGFSALCYWLAFCPENDPFDPKPMLFRRPEYAKRVPYPLADFPALFYPKYVTSQETYIIKTSGGNAFKLLGQVLFCTAGLYLRKVYCREECSKPSLRILFEIHTSDSRMFFPCYFFSERWEETEWKESLESFFDALSLIYNVEIETIVISGQRAEQVSSWVAQHGE